ncbi:MAG: translation initiation factor 2 [Sedimenticola sp.]|nr:translation initiation factor 2 [Sedimenticola sp.]MCW8974932.1 translation initiation factor 2 [Sedimenticola sp.]
MADDPRRVLIETVARIGRETQLHLDERARHFWITNLVIIIISLLLVILAVFNVYYVRVLYKDLDGIVQNMDSMHRNLSEVTGNMSTIAEHVQSIDNSIQYMDNISIHTAEMSQSLPRIGNAMSDMAVNVDVINQDMGLMTFSLFNIEQRTGHMTGNVSLIRQNVRQIARPMGMMNSFFP